MLRSSPDWLAFNLEDSRSFCRNHHFPETTILEFAAHWDQSFTLSFREMRARLQTIARNNLSRAENVRLLESASLNESADGRSSDQLLAFIADDDWLAPTVFSQLDRTSVCDGYLWCSLFLGKTLVDTPVEKAGSALFQRRPPSDTVFTNNYAVTVAAIDRLGLQSLCEHGPAHRALHTNLWQPKRIKRYLSLANKHPCCTVSAYYSMQSPIFRRDPVGVIREQLNQLGDIHLSEDVAWVEQPLRDFIELLSEAAG